MTNDEKLTIALKCLRSIAMHGRFLPSDGLAKEALDDMGELHEPRVYTDEDGDNADPTGMSRPSRGR